MNKVVIDVSDRSKSIYFDTNIYNRLLDDPERDRIVELIKERGLVVVPSVVNLCELLMTSDAVRKEELIRIYDEIRNDFHPLKPFTWLLQESVEAVQQNLGELEIVYPIGVSNATEEICRELMAQKGAGIEPYLQGSRDYIQKIAQRTPLADDVQFFAFVDSENGQGTMLDLFAQICTALGIDCNLDETKRVAIMRSLSLPWKYYLESYAYLFYRRAFPDRSYGKGSNPGSSDLEQCIYLFWPGYFVVEDGIFLGFLKHLGELRSYPTKIMNYTEFNELLSQ